MTLDLGYRVLHRPACPFCRRLRVYLALKGLTVDLVRYDPDHDRDELCAGNPKGQVPTLALPSGLVLFESSVILAYLEDTHPEPSLVASTPEGRASTRLLYDLSDSRLPQSLHGFVRAPLDSPDRARFADDFVRIASDAERYLDSAGPLFEGARFTLADLSVPPVALRAFEAGLPVERFSPRLRAWFAAVAATPAVHELFATALAA